MQAPRFSPRKITEERGAVLVTVLIVATIFAVLAYITLQVALNSVEATDTHANMYRSRLVAEAGLETGAASLRQDLGDSGSVPVYWGDPAYGVSTVASEDQLRLDLINEGKTTSRQVDSFPVSFERLAYMTDTQESMSVGSAESSIIPGSHDDAQYSYQDDYQFSEDYPAYEFQPVRSLGDLVVYSAGEVAEPDGDTTLFSFLRGQYPNEQWTYDVREAGVREPSRAGPYPYIQTDHPYSANQSRGWTVTYQQDPRHTGRAVKGIRLLAALNQVAIDQDDSLYVAPWLKKETPQRFANAGDLTPPEVISDYINATQEVFTRDFFRDFALEYNTLGLYFVADANQVDPTKTYGFRVGGIRYSFDSDELQPYYETPHPYDTIIPRSTPTTLNIQVIYSPYQPLPTSPQIFSQRMRIQFDSNFSLDDGDRLFLFNASDQAPSIPVAVYDNVTPLPADGYAPEIQNANEDLPLGYMLVLVRMTSTDMDGVANYGYKVSGLEYTDDHGDWLRVDNPVMESPHNLYLGRTDLLYTLPNGFFPFPAPLPDAYAGYVTIYRPFCPNKDNVNGEGTVDDWYVEFSEAVDFTASSLNANNDLLRITTPGNLLSGSHETIYFVHANGNLGPLIGMPAGDPQYFDIYDLQGETLDCGDSPLMEIELFSDDVDAYEPTMENFGYRIAMVGYTTSNGVDDDKTAPTIRTDAYFPSNISYPAFGSGPTERGEWWYTNYTAMPDPIVVGLHFDRYNYDLDPGDRIEVYDSNGILIATLLSDSVTGGAEAGGPGNPENPGGEQQTPLGPGAQGPYIPEESAGTFVDLNATFGWVLVPGKTAQVLLIGDGDDNDTYSGFEIDRCGFVNGKLTEIKSYVTDYMQLAYGDYYDRSSGAIEAFRTLGVE